MSRRLLTKVSALLVLGCAACAGVGDNGGGGGAAPPTGAGGFGGTPSGALNIMGFSGEDEVATSRIAAYKAAFPGVQVTNTKGDFDAQQFLTALASGNPPDLVYMDRAFLGTYAAQGAIQPLSDCVSTQGIDTSQYRPAAMKAVTIGGTVYGIPEFSIVTVNMIDASTVQGAGLQSSDIQTKDFSALEATAKKLYAADGGKISRIGYDPKVPDSFPLWAQINGAQIVKEDGTPNLNDPKAVEVVDFTLKLVGDQGGWNTFKAFRDSMDIFGANNPLTTHKLGAMPMDSWYVNVLSGFIDKGLQLDSTMVTDRSGKPVSTLGGQAWAIPKGAKNPAAACAWAKTMTATSTWMAAAKARQDTVTKKNSIFTGIYTANTQADQQIKAMYVKPSKNPGIDKAIENVYTALDVAQPLPASVAGVEISAAWKGAMSRALSGQQTAQQALDQAQQEAKAAYDKAKK